MFESTVFRQEIEEKAGTKLPQTFTQDAPEDSFTQLDGDSFLKSSIGDHEEIISKINDSEKRNEASKARMSENKRYFQKILNELKIQAVSLDKEITLLAGPVDGEDYLQNLERVLKQNSHRTNVVECLKAVDIMRKSIQEGNECKKILRKACASKTTKYMHDLEKQPLEPAQTSRSQEEQTKQLIHFISGEMNKIDSKNKNYLKEIGLIKEKLQSTHKAQVHLNDYVKRIDNVVSTQIMAEVYRRHKFEFMSREYTKYFAKWNDREAQIRAQFTQKFGFENVPAVFGQMLVDARGKDCTSEIKAEPEYAEHRKMWDPFLAEQDKYYKTWEEEYSRIRQETDYSYMQDQMRKLQSELKTVTSERDHANSVVVEKTKAIETMSQEIRSNIQKFEDTSSKLDTEKAGAEELKAEIKRLNGLNNAQASQIKTLTQERDELNSNLAKERQESIRILLQTKSDHEKLVESLKNQIKNLKQEVEAANELSLSKIENEKKLVKELAEKEATSKETASSYALMQGRVAELEKEITQVRKSLSDLDTQHKLKCQLYDLLKSKQEAAG